MAADIRPPSHSTPRSRPISIPVHTLTHDDRALVHAHNAPPPLTPSQRNRRGTSSSPVSIHSTSSRVSHPPASRSQSPEPVLDLVEADVEAAEEDEYKGKSDDEAGTTARYDTAPPSKPASATETVTAKPASSSAPSAASAKPPSKATAQARTTSSPPSTATTAKPRSRAPKSTHATANTSTPNASTSGAIQPAPTKPVSRKQSRSPSPPPPAQPPPLTTIRLDIHLGGPENYEIDIAALAKASGQRPPTPPLKFSRRDEDSSGDESGDGGGGKEKDKERDKDKDNKDKGKDRDRDKDKEKDKGGGGDKDGGGGSGKDGEDGDGEKKKKKKKKHATSEYYDTSDPFIDDSELAIDERTWFAQTKQQGFYVSSGEVALLKDKGMGAGAGAGGAGDKSKKPKSKKAPVSVGPKGRDGTGGEGSASAAGSGARDEDKFVDDERGGGEGSGSVGGSREGDLEDASEVGQKRKRYITVVDQAGKKRKVVDVNSFHPDIQAELETLKDAISKESWNQKGKFPPSIKPFLGSLAMLAIKLGEYDDHFFTLMPTLFPYNKFTMTKLIKRTVFHDHVQFLGERQEALLKELAEQAKAGFAKAEEEWERSVQAWDKRQEKARLEAAAAGGSAGSGGDQGLGDSTSPTRHPTEEMDVDGDPARDRDRDKDREDGAPLSAAPPASTQGGPGGKDPHPPGKKYRLTESMKAIVWELVMLSNECCRLENEKNALEGSVIQVSEQGTRKVLYQKIVAAFPEGWMSSGQISRDVSSMKKKLEKEAMENE